MLSGADISALPEIETAGSVFLANGQSGDEIKILRDAGCDPLRVRLFVRPDPESRKTDGAKQDLAYVRALGKRIKAGS